MRKGTNSRDTCGAWRLRERGTAVVTDAVEKGCLCSSVTLSTDAAGCEHHWPGGGLSQTFDDTWTGLTTSYGELQQRTKELSCLLSVSEILIDLADLSNLDTILGGVLDKALEVIDMDTGLPDRSQCLRGGPER